MTRTVMLRVAVVSMLLLSAAWAEGNQCRSIALEGDYSFTSEAWVGAAAPLAPGVAAGLVTFNATAASVAGRGMSSLLSVSSSDTVKGTFSIDPSCTVTMQLSIISNGVTNNVLLFGVATLDGLTGDGVPSQCGPRIRKISGIAVTSSPTAATRRFTFERIDDTICQINWFVD